MSAASRLTAAAEALGALTALRIGHATGDLPDLRALPGTLEVLADGVRVDVGAATARVGEIPDEPPAPYDAMEHQLLQEAVTCAAGGKQPPRRELVAVALREVRREQVLRDRAEAAELALQQQVRALESAATAARETRRGLVMFNAELLAFAAEQLGCALDSDVVRARLRARRPGLTDAMAAEIFAPGGSRV